LIVANSKLNWKNPYKTRWSC